MTDPSISVTRCAQPGVPSPGCPASGACTTVARTFAVRGTVPPSRYPSGGRPSCGAGPSWWGGYRPVPARRSGPGVKPAPAPGRADLTRRPEWRLDACGPGRQASPPRRPAPGPAASTPGNGEGVPSVTARDHPAPAPAGLPLRQGRAAVAHRPAAQPARAAFPLVPVPRAGRPGPRPTASPAGGGLDAAGGAERPSSRTHGRAAPGNANRSRPAPATPADEPGTPGDPLLTIEEVTAELRVSRAAFYRWRRQGAGRRRCGCPAAACGSGAAR